MIENILLTKLIGEAIEFTKRKVNETIKNHNKSIKAKDSLKHAKLQINQSNIEEAINSHEIRVKNWSKEVSFKDIGEAKSLVKVYVQLDFYLSPIKSSIDSRLSDKIPLSALFKRSNNHLIILGQPGAGKTTSLKFLCHSLLYNGQEYLSKVNFPIFIKLSDLNPTKKGDEFVETIFTKLGEVLDIQIETNLDNYQKQRLLHECTLLVLDKLCPLLVLDGFDEIPNNDLKKVIIDEIQELALGLSEAKFVLTCRTGDFHYNIENANQYEICPLSDAQIKQFTEKWLSDPKLAKTLFQQLKKSPFYDTTIRPLNLAHLTTIFERYGKLPEKPKTVYKKVVSLLLEEWDSQRRVSRSSRYSEFEIDRKLEFLSNLSFQFTYDYGKTVFSVEELRGVYIKICDNYNLPPNQEKQVINELETHNGLFLEAGFQQYTFAHKSIQEYLTAEYIVALPNIPLDKKLLLRIPNEIALAVAISSNPSLYFFSVITDRIKRDLYQDNFIEIFLDRILLEKPDFVSTIEVALSISYIIEILYSRRVIDMNSEQPFDVVIRYISKLVKNKFIKQSFVNLKKYYNFQSIKEDDGFIQVNLNSSMIKSDTWKFPETLFSYSQFHF